MFGKHRPGKPWERVRERYRWPGGLVLHARLRAHRGWLQAPLGDKRLRLLACGHEQHRPVLDKQIGELLITSHGHFVWAAADTARLARGRGFALGRTPAPAPVRRRTVAPLAGRRRSARVRTPRAGCLPAGLVARAEGSRKAQSAGATGSSRGHAASSESTDRAIRCGPRLVGISPASRMSQRAGDSASTSGYSLDVL